MPRARVNQIEIDYAEHGPADGVPLLLIMGLAMQRVAWPVSLLDALANGGFRCITFDNRDIGLSTRCRGARVPGLPRLVAARLSGRTPRLPYRLADLADDAAGLLDTLDIEHAHVAGISMGGMIAQHFAHRFAERTRSLTLMATSTGRLGLPLPRPKVLRIMLRRPRDAAHEDAVARYMLDLFTAIGSPGYPTPVSELEPRVRAAIRRAPAGASVTRQLAAIITDAHRGPLLRSLHCPTLILHGSDDAMVPVAHAHEMSRAMRQATLRIIPGWGHDLPEALMPELARHIKQTATTATNTASSSA